MNNFLDKMERKLGRFAVKNLMLYIIGIYIVGALLSVVAPMFYYEYLSLNVERIVHGEVWRLVTFILEPLSSMRGGTSVIFFCITLYFYWILGTNLEYAWGTFRFNIYYISGILLNIIAAVITYAVTGDASSGINFGLDYINESLLLAYCAMYPDYQVLFMFVLPVKMKYLGIFYGAFVVLQIVQNAAAGNFMFAIAIVVALLNFVWFFFSTKNYRQKLNSKMRRMKFEARKKAAERGFNTEKGVARHKCAICGRTELDDPNLEFRFCSKCEGNYEYCNEHLFTHQHITKS